nr:MAG TPA: hypothetical protein [Caudoviricetes sp.]
MKIFKEESLRYFEFWSGAKENAKELSGEQLDNLETILEDAYPDGIDATTLNDLMWFEFDTIKEWLGIEDDEEEE